MLILAVNVCENRIPALVGKLALKLRLPRLVEFVREMVESEDPSPLAVRVPLIRIDGLVQGTTVTSPSTSEMKREL